MNPVTIAREGGKAYAAISEGTVFASVALSFLGLGWALALMLRPKTSVLCVWSMALFSLAWLTESTTHLLGMGGYAAAPSLQWGVWASAGLFGLGLTVGVLGVLAYLRNEHRYERGLLIGVVASLANLWVVGGMATALHDQRTASLGRGLVIPLMPSGGPMEAAAQGASTTTAAGQQASDKTLKMGAILGRAVSDLAIALSSRKEAVWELHSGSAGDGPAGALAGHPIGTPGVLRALHPGAQHLLTLSSGIGWMSLGLTPAPTSTDPAGLLASRNGKLLEEQALSLTPWRRLQAVRTQLAGFEVIRLRSEASIHGLAGAADFEQWVAVSGGTALEVVTCSPAASPAMLDAANAMVIGVLRTLQHQGISGPIPSELAQSQRQRAEKLEREDRTAEALELWQRAVAATPGDGESFLGAIRCSWKLGKTQAALAWLETGAAPVPGTVSNALGALRIKIATGQPEARKALVERFDDGLADDEALASLMLGCITNDDRDGALKALSAYGPRHGAAAVEKWREYLSPPPTAPSHRVQTPALPAALRQAAGASGTTAAAGKHPTRSRPAATGRTGQR